MAANWSLCATRGNIRWGCVESTYKFDVVQEVSRTASLIEEFCYTLCKPDFVYWHHLFQIKANVMIRCICFFVLRFVFIPMSLSGLCCSYNSRRKLLEFDLGCSYSCRWNLSRSCASLSLDLKITRVLFWTGTQFEIAAYGERLSKSARMDSVRLLMVSNVVCLLITVVLKSLLAFVDVDAPSNTGDLHRFRHGEWIRQRFLFLPGFDTFKACVSRDYHIARQGYLCYGRLTSGVCYANVIVIIWPFLSVFQTDQFLRVYDDSWYKVYVLTLIFLLDVSLNLHLLTTVHLWGHWCKETCFILYLSIMMHSCLEYTKRWCISSS